MKRALKAMPTLLRIGVAETVAYRAEFLVWVLTTTQPLIMMSLMTFITRHQSFKGFSSEQFVAYYLATLIVRQLTGNWVAWQMMEEIRTGTLAMRLLRPIHPFFAYLASHLAAIPFRAAIAVPVAAILLATSGGDTLPHSWLQLGFVPISIFMAWLISFAIFYSIGSLAFFLTQSMAIGNVYFGLFSLFSGYMLPLAMLPHPIAAAADWLPFKFMLAVPVALMTRELSTAECLHLLGGQLVWLAIMIAMALWIWNRGVKRFESVGT
jgi:viologen exporter family transport system permease protein